MLFEKTGPMTLDKIYDWACSKLKTEDIESMEKANPKLSNALKSMIILAKEGVKEAELLSGDLFSDLNAEKNKTVGASPNADFKNRFDEVTNKIDDLVKNKKIDLVVDIGAGFAVRGLVCKNKNIDYIGVDLPAVISEAKEMHAQIAGLTETKFKVADITNYESLKNIVSSNKGKILTLTENIEEDLFDFELKFARENIKRLIHEYDAIYLKSEKSGVELIEKNDVAELDKIRTSTQFNLSHLSSDEDVIVRVEGALDSITSSKLIDYVEGLSVDLQNRNLIINLSKVDYIMPAGLNVLEKIESKYNNVELIFKKV